MATAIIPRPPWCHPASTKANTTTTTVSLAATTTATVSTTDNSVYSKDASTTNECTSIAGNFDGHPDALVQCRVHHPMQHVQGCIGSLQTSPLSDYSLRVTPMATKEPSKTTMMNKYTFFTGCFDGHDNAPIHYCANCKLPDGRGPRLCQETSERDTANKRSLELCASIVLIFECGCCVCCVCDVFLTGLVLGNWYP